ncbi:multicopper oxidase family protein [Nocardia heshunensis]
MAVGRPLADPPEENERTLTLDAARGRVDVGGAKVLAETYNGRFAAPTLHAKPGETLTLTLVNHLPVATNLHFHGLHVSPTGDSDDPFVCVPPGATHVYRLAIPANHPDGTYWYHSHAMGTSCPDHDDAMSAMFMPGDVENQIFDGLSGALIIGDNRDRLPEGLRHIKAHTLVLKDVQLAKNDKIVQSDKKTSIDSNAETVRLVNGQLRPVLTMRPGETQLWRFVNAGADIFYNLTVAGFHFSFIGEDGIPVTQVTSGDNALLPPGKRYDVLLTAPAHAGTAWLDTMAYSNGPQGDSYPEVKLLRVDIAGEAEHAAPTLPTSMPGAQPDLTGASIAQQRSLQLSEDSAGTSFFLNDKQFAMGSSVFATPARLGTVEEWTLTNTAGEDHPFHLHTTSFQVMSINDAAQPYTHRQDIVLVPHAVNGVPGKVTIRIPFDDFAGRWMFHCHIAAHEDNGMMSYIDVQR